MHSSEDPALCGGRLDRGVSARPARGGSRGRETPASPRARGYARWPPTRLQAAAGRAGEGLPASHSAALRRDWRRTRGQPARPPRRGESAATESPEDIPLPLIRDRHRAARCSLPGVHGVTQDGAEVRMSGKTHSETYLETAAPPLVTKQIGAEQSHRSGFYRGSAPLVKMISELPYNM